MAGWAEFAGALVLFLASHAIPARPALKGRLVALLGRRGYLALFNTLSLVLLVWLVVAAGRAPYVPLWYQEIWQRWAVNIVMPIAVVLGVFGLGTVNPLSFGGRAAGFAPEHPGIAGFVRHPLLWAFLLWAAAHLLVNGDLAHVILFGGFALLAMAGMPMIDARKRRQWGAIEWHRLAAHTSQIPGVALLTGAWRPRRGPTLWRLVAAVVLWQVLLRLHPIVIGVSPLP
jgi:uncharacterized membrane protein